MTKLHDIRKAGYRASRTATLAALVACTVALPSRSVQAQTRATPPSRTQALAPGAGVRILRNTFFGALGGSVLAMGYYLMSDRGTRSTGCQPINCALPYLATTGALAGMFIGRELEGQRRAESPRTGESFDFGTVEAEVRGAPNGMDVRDSLIAVVTDSGTQILSASPRPAALRSRAAGLSNLRQVVIVPQSRTIVLGTGTALWEASLGTGPASRIADGPIDALAASSDAVLSARGSVLRLRRGSGPGERVDSLEMGSQVSSLAFDETSGSWWAAIDSALVPLTVGAAGLVRGTALATPATARSITSNAGWVAAALGDEGVIAWRRESLGGGVLTPVRLVQEPRFAYDLAFLGDLLYVAGGVDGLYRLQLSPVPQVLGSSRQFPFATTVRSEGGVLWVGDRVRKAVIRVTP